MRFNKVGWFGVTQYSMDMYHNQIATVVWDWEKGKVYYNPYYDNANLQQQAGVNDLFEVHQLEVMTSQYHGEKWFRFTNDDDAPVYTITNPSLKGDRTVLTVERKLGDQQ